MNTKNTKNQSNKSNKNHDVAGIICVVIASFFLICLITPLLSDIGAFVKRLTTGLLGYMSYPIVLCTLLFGVLLLMNKKLVVTGKQLSFIFLMAICAVLILQTALDASRLNGSFGEYLSSLISFDTNNVTAGQSVGGVVFGIFAYLFKTILTFVGAYILYALIFTVFAVILFFDCFATFKKPAVKQKKPESYQFVKGQNSAQPVKEINDTSLFIGTIEPHKMSESGDFASIYDQNADSMPRYEQAPAIEPEFDSSQKDQALKKLFGDTDEMLKKYDVQLRDNMRIFESHPTGRSNYLIDDDKTDIDTHITNMGLKTSGFVSSKTIMSSPSINNGEKEPKSKLPDVPMPPDKDISDQIIEGPIINGDEVSKRIQDDRRMRRTQDEGPVRESKDSNNSFKPDLPPIITSNPVIKDAHKAESSQFDKTEKFDIISDYKEAESKPVIEDEIKENIENESQTEIEELPPIISDYKEAESEPAIEDEIKENIENESQTEIEELPPIISDYEEAENEPVIEEHSLKQETYSNYDAPILNGDTFTEEDSFKPQDGSFLDALSDEVDTVGDEQLSNEHDVVVDDRTDINETSSIAKEEKTPKPIIPDSLKLIDDAVDMSEKNDEVENDNTGYYVREFDKNVNNLSLKLKDKTGINGKSKVKNQMHMDDFDVLIPEQEPKKVKKPHKYIAPPIDYLEMNKSEEEENIDFESNARNLEEALRSLRVEATVTNITHGPAVTRYELQIPPGQSVQRMPSYAKDIAYSLASNGKIRIEAPITGKRAVGVEVPNEKIAIVSLREIIDSKEFSEAKSCLTLALGKDITGNIMVCNLEKMPHLLIAGTTGSGKSACLNCIIMSILYKASPDDVRLILVDPKQVEFVLYREMPHLLIKKIITDNVQANNAFKWACDEMERRYTTFAKYSSRNLADFNDSEIVKSGVEAKMPRIVIIVDELADLMMARNSREIEDNLKRLAQKARAAGIHLILATQRPSVDVLTGTIKTNFPSRIAFAVKSMPDSKTILDNVGAETLLGRGDMLYAPIDYNEPKRVQGAFITTEEITNIVNFVRENNEAEFDEAAEKAIMYNPEDAVASNDNDSGEEITEDPLMKDVLRKVIETGQASASQIQRRFAVGYNRASRIIDQMEENGYIGPLDGSKPREVFITRQMFAEIYGEEA